MRAGVRDCGSRISRKTVAEKVQTQHGHEDREAGEDRDPGSGRDLVARIRQHAAPTRKGRPDPEAQKRQGRFRKNRTTHAQRADDDDRTQHIGQKLRQHDANVTIAQHFRRLNVALGLEGQGGRARETAGERPVGQTERDEQ